MSTTDSSTPFAFWVDPISGIKINYSLPLFHEIDFQVNEGYRRIPHGGVEVGGILYGRAEEQTLAIEQFRPIECEHASGPSFHLSERDLAVLKESILKAANDEELQGLLPLGWFISHTRSSLRMSDRELELFQRFFPEPNRVAILVKPERYKPTRFAFLTRDKTGLINPEGEARAVILPLPGRAGATGQAAPAPAIPAPVQPSRPNESSSAHTAAPESVAPNKPIEEQRDSAEEIADRASPSEPPAVPASVSSDPDLPRDDWQPARAVTKSHPARFLLILLLAAALGCGAGYWAYLQLPPPVIALRVQKQSKGLLILWDPNQTQSARFATIRVNDSRAVLLTDEQKAAGLAEVPLAENGDSVKVEILAQHWIRESRGIIRFVPAQRSAASSPTTEGNSPPAAKEP